VDAASLAGIFASPWSIIRTLLDIAIVAYIFYRLLVFMQGHRAEQLLKGLFILLVFSALVNYLQFDMLSWLLEKLWIVFAIALPIVFQPELRRFLEQIGRGHIFYRTRQGDDLESDEYVVKELITAATILAHNRIGALIVIARDTDIHEYLDSGTPMESLVSAGLLINVFVPNTPLHDGAVIIRNGRIERAACFLPLSNNPAIDIRLGTRHRAGLGITEVSDALAIIVSEETGAVSVAKEGRLVRYLDEQDLQDRLESELVARPSRGESFWRRWTGDARQAPKPE